ncbi:hypothetical protein ANTRET_LOCUS3876 [Anthophora retusa]
MPGSSARGRLTKFRAASAITQPVPDEFERSNQLFLQLLSLILVISEQVRSAGGHMVKQRRFIGNTNNKMINIREYL